MFSKSLPQRPLYEHHTIEVEQASVGGIKGLLGGGAFILPTLCNPANFGFIWFYYKIWPHQKWGQKSNIPLEMKVP